jgi:hypothetical protein
MPCVKNANSMSLRGNWDVLTRICVTFTVIPKTYRTAYVINAVCYSAIN